MILFLTNLTFLFDSMVFHAMLTQNNKLFYCILLWAYNDSLNRTPMNYYRKANIENYISNSLPIALIK